MGVTYISHRSKGTVCMGTRGGDTNQPQNRRTAIKSTQHLTGLPISFEGQSEGSTVLVKIHLSPPFLHEKEDMRPSGEPWGHRAEGT